MLKQLLVAAMLASLVGCGCGEEEGIQPSGDPATDPVAFAKLMDELAEACGPQPSMDDIVSALESYDGALNREAPRGCEPAYLTVDCWDTRCGSVIYSMKHEPTGYKVIKKNGR